MLESKRMIVTTSWDDGHSIDIKLASLLSEFGIRGTFYVAPHNRKRIVMGPPDLRALNKYFEIGAHSMTHPDLRCLSGRNLKKEIGGSKLELEDLISAPVHMFCYPWGRYNRQVRQAVISAGFIGARTTKEFFLNPGTDVWRMPTTIQAFPHPSLIRFCHGVITGNWNGLKKVLEIGVGKSWVQLACDFFEKVLASGGVWHLWGHSWEIEKHHLWADLRMVLESVAHREGVCYLTNGQVIRELAKHRIIG